MNCREIWGVVGGMGPLASAEFLKTVYEACLGPREQDTPAVILLSDPSFPDRTEALLDGREDLLLEMLQTSLEKLLLLGATRLIICCTTLHHVLPRLDAGQLVRIVSLLDVIMEQLLLDSRRRLLLCTEGTRRLRLFESHPLWGRVGQRIVLPSGPDQRRIHQMIYELKSNRRLPAHTTLLEELAAQYEIDGFIAGCTEIHLTAKDEASRFTWLDPLAALADQMAGGPAAIPQSLPLLHA